MVPSRLLLSGSSDGQPIKVAATATPGTAIHTAVAGSAAFDCLHLWVTNTSGSAALLTIEFGGASDPDNLIVKGYSVPANSAPIKVLDGQMLNNAKTVKAFCPTANVLLITGHVNRIS